MIRSKINKKNFSFKGLIYVASLIMIFSSYNKLNITNIEIKLNNDNKSIYLASTTSKIIYVTQGNETSQAGDGTSQNPYLSLSYAISQANHGDTIKLMTGIIYRQQVANETFKIDKSITIDGQNNYLNFRGSNLEILANVKLTNMTLEMIPDGAQQSKIYVSGNQITFDNVSTSLGQAQYDQRPTIIGGSKDYNPMGSHTVINILNGNSETRFKEIIVGKENGNISTPATININSTYAKVDNGIILGGTGSYQVTGKVKVTSNSKNIKSIIGTNSPDNEITIRAANIYSLNLINIKNLILSDNASLSLDNFYGLNGNIEVKSGSKLWLNTPGTVQVNNLLGTGEIIISTSTPLNVKQSILDAIKIKLDGFDSDLQRNLNKIFVSVEGSINSGANVSLYSENSYYTLQKDNNKYKLVESSPFDKNRIKKIEIIQNPSKLSYVEGEKLNLTDLLLILTDSNGVEQYVDSSNFSEYNITYTPTSALKTTHKEISINVNNLKETIPITVTKKSSTTPSPSSSPTPSPSTPSSPQTPSSPTKTQAQTYEPIASDKTIIKGEKLKPDDVIKNKNSLPKNITYKFKKSVNVSKVGKQKVEVIVTYSDGSSDTVSFVLTIKNKDNNTTQSENKTPMLEDKLNNNENKPVLIPDNQEENILVDDNTVFDDTSEENTVDSNLDNEDEPYVNDSKNQKKDFSIIASIIGITVVGVSIPVVFKIKKLIKK